MDAPVDDGPSPAPAAGPAPSPPSKSALAFFVLLFLLLPLGIAAQAASRAAGLLWSEVFVFLVPALVATAGSNLRAGPWLGLGRTAPVLLVLGGLAGASATLLAVALQATIVRLVPEAWLEAFDLTELFRGPAWERWVLAATATFVAPVCEEIAFRGHLLRTLRLRLGVAASIAASALLFALVHLDPVRFVGLAGLGALFAWLAVRGGTLWPAMAAHAGNNAVVSWVLVTGDAGVTGASRTAALDVPPPAPQVLAVTALGLGVLVPVLLAFRREAGALPPAPDPLQPRDPAAGDLSFHLRRVPRTLRLVVAAGAAALAALVALR